ncbi:hypothetical protein NGI46_08080 [Peribacillus butanolivorans]|uniref:hypothetical protein n=1 Tax=Peribacillus butanolivorans TaxID=421767 RepID=UPI00207C88B6|nr:hypothetical protein [Peribacillus butanolivorans]MCO0597425.1 hypothetical protein [Peribacillus butanolivorans]
MNNQQLNNLVVRYQSERSDETFGEIYEMVAKGWRSLATVAKSIRATEAETLAAYEDVLIKCIEAYDATQGHDFINLLNRCIWRERRGIYRKKKTLNKHEVYEAADEDGAATSRFEIADEFNLEETVVSEETAKRKADQLALIDSLVCGENERTTAIVQAYLTTDLKTPTAIGKHLGLDHKQVSRALIRLASKYSTKQHGDFRDYLVAL